MPPARETSRTTIPVTLAGQTVVLDHSGAAWLPETGDLLVADLHFEKGSAFAARGQALPYDTAETIKRLEKVIARVKPERVVCMGDTLHDLAGETRMSETDRTRLGRMVGARTGCGSRAITIPPRRPAMVARPAPSCAWATFCCITTLSPGRMEQSRPAK